MYLKMSSDYELAASAATAEQAVNFCCRNPAGLVIMDVMMRHGLDRLTCAEMIRNNTPRIRIIPWFKEYSVQPLLDVMNRTNEEIAEKNGISLNTVKRHIQNMLNKTGCRNRLELVVNAEALGLAVHRDDRKGRDNEDYQ